MASPELQKLTASEPLTLEEEYDMQRSWREDNDSESSVHTLPRSIQTPPLINEKALSIEWDTRGHPEGCTAGQEWNSVLWSDGASSSTFGSRSNHPVTVSDLTNALVAECNQILTAVFQQYRLGGPILYEGKDELVYTNVRVRF